MAIFFDAPVSPDALTEFVRQMPVPAELTLSRLFPVRLVDNNEIDFTEIIQTNRTARFRAYDARVHVSERDVANLTKVKLPALSDSLNMGEYERLQLQFARTAGTNQEALARAIYNDGEQLTRNVRNRMEQAWGDVVADGKLTINEEGLVLEADYGVPAGQLVTAGTVWSDTANATILDDLIAWYDVALANLPSGMWRTSKRVLRYILRNTQIINAVRGSGAGVTRVRLDELNDLMDSEQLPRFSAATLDTEFDVDGTDTRVLPDDVVALTPTDENLGQLGFTAYGVSATALEMVNSEKVELSFEDAPGIVGIVVKSDGVPFRQFTYVDAVGMPVIQDPKKLLVGTVL